MTTMKDLIRDFGTECRTIDYRVEREAFDYYHDINGVILADQPDFDIVARAEEIFEELLDELMEELKKFYE